MIDLTLFILLITIGYFGILGFLNFLSGIRMRDGRKVYTIRKIPGTTHYELPEVASEGEQTVKDGKENILVGIIYILLALTITILTFLEYGYILLGKT